MSALLLVPVRREGNPLSTGCFPRIFTHFWTDFGACFQVHSSLYWVYLFGKSTFLVTIPQQ